MFGFCLKQTIFSRMSLDENRIFIYRFPIVVDDFHQFPSAHMIDLACLLLEFFLETRGIRDWCNVHTGSARSRFRSRLLYFFSDVDAITLEVCLSSIFIFFSKLGSWTTSRSDSSLKWNCIYREKFLRHEQCSAFQFHLRFLTSAFSRIVPLKLNIPRDWRNLESLSRSQNPSILERREEIDVSLLRFNQRFRLIFTSFVTIDTKVYAILVVWRVDATDMRV